MRVIGRALSLMLLGLAMLGLGCKEVTVAPAGLSYAASPASYVVGTAITPNAPTHSGGDIASYAVNPALPGGLSLDAKSGVISGTPTLATATTSYTVTASNAGGSSTASLSITVTGPIAITVQPADQSIMVGQTATFSVAATGTAILTYQWLRNGVVIAGAGAASYTTPAAVLGDNGSTFSVQVSDSAGGSITSKSATLTVAA